jgi:hypothetical protein
MSAKFRHDAGTLYNIAIHEAGHAVMAVHQGIGDMAHIEDLCGYCVTVVEGFSAKQWTTLAGPVVSAIHENTSAWEQLSVRGGDFDFESVTDRRLERLLPVVARAEFGFPAKYDDLVTFVSSVLDGFRPNGAKGVQIRSIRKFAKRCEKVLGFIEDSIDDDIESIRQWILDEGWLMPRVYRPADVLVEKRKMEAEEILRWFIRDGEYRWLKPAA